MNKQEANKAKQPVVEMYFEAMKKRCDGKGCQINKKWCLFWDACDENFGSFPYMYQFSDLSEDIKQYLEPYAKEWAGEASGSEHKRFDERG